MKSLNSYFVFFFVLCFITQISMFSSKKNLARKTKLKKFHKHHQSDKDYFEIGVTSNLPNERDLPVRNIFKHVDAVTYAKADGGFEIPKGHPLLEMKNPKYVEGIRYYENQPNNKESEAISIDKLDDDYYQPFKNSSGRIRTSNCGDIESMYICAETRFCLWDNLIKSCVFDLKQSHSQGFLNNKN